MCERVPAEEPPSTSKATSSRLPCVATGDKHQQALLPRWIQHKDVSASSFSAPSLRFFDTRRQEITFFPSQTTTSTSRDSVLQHSFNDDGKRLLGPIPHASKFQEVYECQNFCTFYRADQLYTGVFETEEGSGVSSRKTATTSRD